MQCCVSFVGEAHLEDEDFLTVKNIRIVYEIPFAQGEMQFIAIRLVGIEAACFAAAIALLLAPQWRREGSVGGV